MLYFNYRKEDNMKTDNKESVPSVKGLDKNEVPTLKKENDEVVEKANTESPIGKSEVVEPTPEAASNKVNINMEAFNVNSIPKTSKETSAIDPLAVPTTAKKVESTFDPMAMPTTSSNGAFDPSKVPTNTTTKTNDSKLPLIIGIAAAALIVIGIIITVIANSSNKLKCTSEESYGIKYSYEMKFDSDDNIKSMYVVMDMDMTDESEGMSEAELDKKVDELKEELKETGENIKVSRSGKIFKVSMEYKDIDSFGVKKSDIKTRLENRNFTCK
jgi:hypothetical protein